MAEAQTLRLFVHQRLTAAAEDIFEQFERTIAKYEEQLSRQQKRLDAVFQPQVRLRRTDEEELVVIKTVWNQGLDQDEPQELPQVKDEQEEVQTSPEGDQFEGLDETNLIQLASTPVPVKKEEDDKEEAQSFQHHNNQTKDGSDSDDLETEAGGSEAAKNLSEENSLQTETHVNKSDSSQAQNDNSSDAEETGKSKSALNPLQNLEGSVSDVGCPSGKTLCSLSEDVTDSGHKEHVQEPNGILPVDSLFRCSVCGKTFPIKAKLRRHMTCHKEGKPFRCSLCKKTLAVQRHLYLHRDCHNERPFSCSVCKKTFPAKCYLVLHMVCHKKDKPFSCSVCKKEYTWQTCLNRHMALHSEENSFRCSICKNTFTAKRYLKSHMYCHKNKK